jgi:serine protease AprX
MNKKIKQGALIICFFVLGTSIQAQKKFWILFKNKTGTPYSINTPASFLTQKSIARRALYNIPYDNSDLPVTPGYITQVDNVPNVTVLYASKWLNGVVVSIPDIFVAAALSAINANTFVLNSAQVNRYKINLPKEIESTGTPNNQLSARSAGTNSFDMGVTTAQNQQIGVNCLHEQGFRGQGMTIAVLDIGFNSYSTNPLFDSLRNRGGILGTRDFVDGGNDVEGDGGHGANVLSCMAAVKHKFYIGTAPMANYWLLRTETGPTETISEEYNWVRGAEFADSVGVDMLTTSLGYTEFDNPAQNHTQAMLNGRTAPMSIAATMAARKGMFVLNAAGNEGQSSWQKISVPADADSICTVGAIDSLSNVAAFSSVGPTADLRIKPDLVARGQGAWIIGTGGNYAPANGTSFATPILAGAIACHWQANRALNNMAILRNLKATASNAASPNNSRGWGTPNVCQLKVGIQEKKQLKITEISCFPNPFDTEINIQVDQTENSPVTIEVYDLMGKVITSIVSNKTEVVLNTGSYADGLYFVKVKTQNATYTKKLVKNR